MTQTPWPSAGASVYPGPGVASCYMCQKARFSTKGKALKRLDEIDAERPRKPGRKLPIRTYFCRHCKGWHLTSSPYRPRRA